MMAEYLKFFVSLLLNQDFYTDQFSVSQSKNQININIHYVGFYKEAIYIPTVFVESTGKKYTVVIRYDIH
jgi:hypothetical protein